MKQSGLQIITQMRMRKALLKTMALTATALWLTACSSSPPVRFYSLATPEANAQTAAPTPIPTRRTAIFIDVGPVGVPERLTRPQLVVQQGDRMEILEQDRWTSSFNNELHDTLA